MFIGYVPLNGTAFFLMSVVDTNGSPAAPDSMPTFRVYGSDSATPKATGTVSAFDATNLDYVYKGSFTVSGAFARSGNYQIVANWGVGLQPRQQVFSFSVY